MSRAILDEQLPIALAREGLAVLKAAIVVYLSEHPQGAGNSVIAKELGLESSHLDGQKNHLTYSLLGILMKEGKVEKIGEGNGNYYVLVS